MITLRRVPRRPLDETERLRVAIVAESFLPTVNGVTNSVLRLLEHLQRRGHEAVVIAPGPGDRVIGGTPVIRVRGFDLPGYGSLRVGSPVVRMASMLREFSPDVVHLAAPSLLGAAGARAARRLGLPSVAVFQTDLVGFARRYGLARVEQPLWHWIRWVHAHADLTLAPSTAAVWTLRTRGISNVARWQRGVDLERFHPSHRSAELRRTVAPDGAVIVGYVGRLAKEKQVERLEPVSRLDGVHVVVVGDGPERTRLERALPRATFTGFRAGPELSALHASFDVFAHTGLDETFCQSLQESMASGIAVVAPAAGGPIDLVTHGRTGYLWSPEQPEMLTGAVAELAASPLLRRQIGREARASVESRPWDVVMDDLIDHYRMLVRGQHTSLRGAA